MKRLRFILGCLLAITPLVMATAAYGQRSRSSLRLWRAEASIKYTIVENDDVIVAGARIGKQMSSNFFLGGSASALMEQAETLTLRGYERVRSLVHAGPTIEYSDSAFRRIRWYIGVTVSGGLARYESSQDDVVDNRWEPFVGAEPEIGLLLAPRYGPLGMRVSLSFLVGYLPRRDMSLNALPAACFGLRLSL